MGVTTVTEEFKVSVPASRMFKACLLDSQNFIPKVMPQIFSRIEVIGDGGVGTIQKTIFPEGFRFKYMKHKVEALDIANYYVKYTLFEGDVLGDKLEFIVIEDKYEDLGDTCVIKKTTSYHGKCDFQIGEESIKEDKAGGEAIFKAAEEYLLANPNAYV